MGRKPINKRNNIILCSFMSKIESDKLETKTLGLHFNAQLQIRFITRLGRSPGAAHG